MSPCQTSIHMHILNIRPGGCCFCKQTQGSLARPTDPTGPVPARPIGNRRAPGFRVSRSLSSVRLSNGL
eukprot:666964-Hanusia_phi.AAC.2